MILIDRTLVRRLLAELLGSAFLAASVIGSGIAAQHLSPNAVGLELFENAPPPPPACSRSSSCSDPSPEPTSTPSSHSSTPALGACPGRTPLAYSAAQIAGCILGAVAANAMFAQALISISAKHRASPAHLLAEIIATLGLLLVIFSLARTNRGSSAPAAVGAYIGAAYFFTSSTSFANPAITLGRTVSNTFAGIAPPPHPATRPHS